MVILHSSLSSKLSFPLQIPHPAYPSIETYLNQATLYRVEPCDASSNSKGWLIKVEESKNNTLGLLSPISDRRVMHLLNTSSPMVLNLLNYRVFELCKSYTTQRTGHFYDVFNKVVFFPNSCWIDVEDSVACCIFREGGLKFMKHGDEKWTCVGGNYSYYHDVVVCKGKFNVTGKRGNVSWADISSLKLRRYCPPFCRNGDKSHLVESCGSIYLVVRYSKCSWWNTFGYTNLDAVVERFEVYKKGEGRGRGTWVEVKNLGDRVFILGNSCSFSVSAKEVNGYQGNCIYLTDHMRSEYRVYKYNLEDHSMITIDLDLALKSLCGLTLLDV